MSSACILIHGRRVSKNGRGERFRGEWISMLSKPTVESLIWRNGVVVVRRYFKILIDRVYIMFLYSLINLLKMQSIRYFI